MGMGHLFAIAGGGQAILNNFGLIDGALDAVFAIWSQGFRSQAVFVFDQSTETNQYTGSSIGQKPH